MTPTFYTLTGNLLAEHTLTFPAWSAGERQRATDATFQVGGKGINVSRMLMCLGAPTTALLFAGGATGTRCRAWLRTHGLSHRHFSSAIDTRIGFVVRAPGQAETTFLGPDAGPEATAWSECANFIDSLRPGHVLALCGSFPGWTSPAADSLRAALTRWLQRGVLVADTYGPPLEWAVQQPVALIKINRAEFDGLWPEAERHTPVDTRLATAAHRWPAKAWIVTDGARPVLFAQQGGSPAQLNPPPVQVVSATGSGDVLLAGVLHALFRQKLTLAEAVAYALPLAAANTASPGIAEFDLNNPPARGSVQP